MLLYKRNDKDTPQKKKKKKKNKKKSKPQDLHSENFE